MKVDNSQADFFFLDTKWGKLFCVYRHSSPDIESKGDIIFVHSFGDELNKSRRMVALQSSEFAKLGYGVLQMDLFGCGDSEGGFEEAEWDIWLDNIHSCVQWLYEQEKFKIHFWGMRLGALLAVSYAGDKNLEGQRFILWQPVISGKKFLNQFMRHITATAGDGKSNIVVKKSQLENGTNTEVAGYIINAELYKKVKCINLDRLVNRLKPTIIDWFEINSLGEKTLTAASDKLVNSMHTNLFKINKYVLPGPPFWATVEIEVLENLIVNTNFAVNKW